MKKLTLIILVILFSLYNYTEKGYASERKRIIVMPFEGNAEMPIKNSVQWIYMHKLYNKNKGNDFLILEREKLQIILNEKKVKDEASRERLKHHIKVGKTIASDYLIFGDISKNEKSNYEISSRIINVLNGEILFSYNENINNKDQLPNVVNNMAENAFIDLRSLNREWFMGVNGQCSFLTPIGSFSGISSPGYGFTTDFIIGDLFFNNFVILVETGFFNFNGKSDYENIKVIPVLIGNRYIIQLSNNFFISPEIYVGTAYVIVNKNNSDNAAFEPMFFSGLSLYYKFNRTMSVFLNTRYGFIVESNDIAQMAMFSLGFGVNF